MNVIEHSALFETLISDLNCLKLYFLGMNIAFMNWQHIYISLEIKTTTIPTVWASLHFLSSLLITRSIKPTTQSPTTYKTITPLLPRRRPLCPPPRRRKARGAAEGGPRTSEWKYYESWARVAARSLFWLPNACTEATRALFLPWPCVEATRVSIELLMRFLYV